MWITAFFVKGQFEILFNQCAEINFKVGLSPSKKKIICVNDSPSKMKNAFYFILNAPFLLNIFKFLSWLFGHAEKGLN